MNKCSSDCFIVCVCPAYPGLGWHQGDSLLCCLSLVSLFHFSVVAGWNRTPSGSLKHLCCCMYMYCYLVHGLPFRFVIATKMLWRCPAASSVILCAKFKTCRWLKTSQLLGQGTTIWYITEHQWVVSLAFYSMNYMENKMILKRKKQMHQKYFKFWK